MNTNINTEYENALRYVMENGAHKEDRTGTGTKSVFGHQMRFNLQDGFPLITTKKVFLRGVAEELFWFLRGSTNSHELEAINVNIWKEWAAEDGELGPIYGAQWVSWKDYDGSVINQIDWVINEIKRNPDSRRLIVSAWNVADLDQMKLMPCHTLFQFYVNDGKLSCQLYQRSADLFLGVPFNIASYALLTHLVAQQTGLDVGEFIWSGGDCHIYDNHVDQVNLQLSRETYPFPSLQIQKKESIYDYIWDDIKLIDYVSHPAIKGEVAV